MRYFVKFQITLLMSLLLLIACAGAVLAVPDTISVQLTNVTPTSVSVVWMTDIPAEPDVEVYSDAATVSKITDGIYITAMPDTTSAVAAAAKNNGIMKVRVSGLSANTKYYVKTVTRDSSLAENIGYSGIMEVTTAKEVVPYRVAADGTLLGFANDLMTMKVYIRPNDVSAVPGLGNIIILESSSLAYPISAFVGTGINPPNSVLDLNNVFDQNLKSYSVQGGEKGALTIYRGGMLSSLNHYRWLPVPTNGVAVAEPVRGFFADLNLDNKVNVTDLELFRKQYRTVSTDSSYNPDYDFVDEVSGKVDARDFASFAREYGRSDVK